MRDSQVKQLRAKLNKTVEEIDESTSEEEMMHKLIEALSDKIEDMNLFVSQTHSLLTQSPSQTHSDFRSCSTTCNTNSLTSVDSSTELTNSNYSISSYLSSLTSPCSLSACSSCEEKNTKNDDRNRIFGSGFGGNVASKKVSPEVILMGSSNYEYQSEKSNNYNYGFTNSEFFAFIAALDPVEYILVVTVIGILLATQLNLNEQQLVGGAFIDIGVILGNIVEQTLFQRARQNEIATRKRQAAFQTDIDNIYKNLIMLQEEINALRDELQLD